MAKKDTDDNKKPAMTVIKEHIADGTFKTLYLFTGNEPYLRKQFLGNLLSALGAEDGSMNFTSYSNSKPDVKSIIADADTMPFFADKRVILVEESGFFNSGENDELIDYLPNLPESSVLIFHETEVDKRTKLYKAVVKYGCALSFDTPDDNMLSAWIKSNVKNAGLTITNGACYAILNNSEHDMISILNELEKLIGYCYDKKIIDIPDVNLLCAKKVEDKIFELLDAISNQDKKSAVVLYNDLLLLRDDPMHILALIQRNYNLLSQVKLMQKNNSDFNEIVSTLKLHPYPAKKYVNQAKAYDYKVLLRCYDMCIDLNTRIRSGLAGDTAKARESSLETLILNLINMPTKE